MAPSTSNRWITDPEYFDLLNYLIERAENVKSPMNIQSLAREFKTTSAAVQSVSCLVHRIEALRTWIQSSEHIDKNILRKNAFVEVNDEKQITHYKANDGSLELGGDQSQSAKNRTAQVETKRSYRSLIIDYFANKKNADTSPKTEKQSEMWNLIELITEKCENVNTPLSINRLAKDFNQRFGVSVHLLTIHKRIKVYCREIQTMEFLDTHSKIRQLFGLSATLDSDYIEKLRKVAFVKVDLKNRIIEYISNDGSLTLQGSHWDSGKTMDQEIPKSIKRKTQTTGSSSSKRARPSSNDLWTPDELADYDPNDSVDDQVKLEPFRGSIQEDFREIEEDEDIQQIPKPLQPHDEHNQIEEVQVKIEHEEPVEVKPEPSHSSRIKFFEAIQSLIVCLDSPFLSWIQSKIHHKIQQLGESDEVIQNNEIVLIIDLLIARMTNHFVVNLSENAESVNFSNFLCYLKASILNSKMSGVEGLVKNISELIEESQNKRIPAEEVENALLITLDIDSF